MWKPTDEKQAKIKETFLEQRAPDHQLHRAKAVRLLVIESIPFNIEVARFGPLAMHATRPGKYCPPLTMTDVGEDPFTITETNRRTFPSSTLKLQDALQRSEPITAIQN